ncbi:MAG: TfoX/Sxy family protein [Chloroflexi bacterium]|nr:TfoX/Sxy family protein [Chloroflexota bacterium]
MKWRPAPPALVRKFDSVMEAVPQAERRKMFGYPAAFANGYMFAGLHQDSFVLRLSPADYSAFLKLEGARPFEPMPGRTMAGFVSVPPTVLESEGEIETWLEKAFAHANSLPPKEPKAKTRRAKGA